MVHLLVTDFNAPVNSVRGRCSPFQEISTVNYCGLVCIRPYSPTCPQVWTQNMRLTKVTWSPLDSTSLTRPHNDEATGPNRRPCIIYTSAFLLSPCVCIITGIRTDPPVDVCLLFSVSVAERERVMWKWREGRGEEGEKRKTFPCGWATSRALAMGKVSPEE